MIKAPREAPVPTPPLGRNFKRWGFERRKGCQHFKDSISQGLTEINIRSLRTIKSIRKKFISLSNLLMVVSMWRLKRFGRIPFAVCLKIGNYPQGSTIIKKQLRHPLHLEFVSQDNEVFICAYGLYLSPLLESVSFIQALVKVANQRCILEIESIESDRQHIDAFNSSLKKK